MANSVSTKTVATDKDVASASPGVYRVAHARRLYLKKTGPDAGSYFLRYRLNGRRPEMGVGSIADLKIGRARDIAGRLASRLADDVDPLAERRQAAAAARAAHEAEKAKTRIPTVKAAVMAYVEAQPKAKWERSRALGEWLNPIAMHAYPVIGAMKVNAVEVRHIVAMMKAIDDKGLSSVRNKVIVSLAAVFNMSAVRKHMAVNPAAREAWKADYTPPKDKGGNYRRMDDLDGAPAVFQGLMRASGNDAGAAAWSFMILAAARPSEALEASWSEFNLAKRLWTIPAARTKTGKDHAVPLSTAAMQILDARAKARPSTSSADGFVFGGKDGRPASYSFFTSAPKRVKVEGAGAAHSWRSVFADIATDRLHVPSEVRETCLAHSIGKVAEAYRRATGVEGRAVVMEKYAAWLMSQPDAGNVVPFAKTA